MTAARNIIFDVKVKPQASFKGVHDFIVEQTDFFRPLGGFVYYSSPSRRVLEAVAVGEDTARRFSSYFKQLERASYPSLIDTWNVASSETLRKKYTAPLLLKNPGHDGSVLADFQTMVREAIRYCNVDPLAICDEYGFPPSSLRDFAEGNRAPAEIARPILVNSLRAQAGFVKPSP